MLQLVIVDDEYYFREYLKTCIDWHALGVAIAGEAANGEDGLALIFSMRPDIVLLDVNMPNLTGLEVSRAVRERALPCKIVILSGHNEFEYAQKAIQYGVKSYLLKPIAEEELCETILGLKAEIESTQRSFAQIDTLKEQVRKSEPIVREQFLNELLLGSARTNTLPQAAQSLWEELQTQYCRYLVLVFELEENAGGAFRVEEKNLRQYAVRNIAQELVAQRETAFFCTDAAEHIVCIVARTQTDTAVTDVMRPLLQNVVWQVKKALGFALTAAMGNITLTADMVCISYEQALYALQNKTGKECVVDYETVKSSISHEVVITADTRTRFLVALRTQSAPEAAHIVQDVFAQAQSHALSREMLHCHCIELLFCCMEYLSEASIRYAEVFPNSSSMFDLLRTVHTADDAVQALTDTCADILRFVETKKPARGKRQAEEIKAYVAQHYCEEDFNVEAIAAHFCVNYHHMCHSFKKQTGITLNNLIYEMRMEKVKSLIAAGGRNLTRLCDEVGYKDVGYFSKCFKKYTGITLTEYINRADL